jgi:hypothetical protein
MERDELPDPRDDCGPFARRCSTLGAADRPISSTVSHDRSGASAGAAVSLAVDEMVPTVTAPA